MTVWDFLYGLKWRWLKRSRPEMASWGLDGLPGCARRSQRWALQVGFPHIWQPAGESALVVEWRCRRCGALAVRRLEEGEPEAG